VKPIAITEENCYNLIVGTIIKKFSAVCSLSPNSTSWPFEQYGVRFHVFQDDDFAARTPAQRRWLSAFLLALKADGLVGEIDWKITCRVDDLEDNRLQEWIKHGLMCVYLGVEAGNLPSLRTLNKHVTVEQNLAAIQMLKQHNVLFSIGFMLFDPSSTVETLRENINFLQRVSLGGSYPVNFCKMLPYAGTPIEDRLVKEGRLKGSIIAPDLLRIFALQSIQELEARITALMYFSSYASPPGSRPIPGQKAEPLQENNL
jgi:radical SAM superfamily enzyme YgiQ (UPF0313 family)